MIRIGTAFAIALLVVSAGVAPALARPTARASGAQDVYTGPSLNYPIVDRLKDQEKVYIDDCTRRQRWCHVIQLDGGPSGWILGSYLIGSAAKNLVTPFEFRYSPYFPNHHLHDFPW